MGTYRQNTIAGKYAWSTISPKWLVKEKTEYSSVAYVVACRNSTSL